MIFIIFITIIIILIIGMAYCYNKWQTAEHTAASLRKLRDAFARVDALNRAKMEQRNENSNL